MAHLTKFDEFEPGEGDRAPLGAQCVACDQMLVDALDGALAPEDQAWFDRHTASCVRCIDMMGEAQRGAAWLTLLKTSHPEPSAALLDRILAQTSVAFAQTSVALNQTSVAANMEADGHTSAAAATPLSTLAFAVRPSATPGVAPLTPVPAHPRPAVLSFPARWFQSRSFLHGFEPRLALTAAMAFFSIALTLNLTGIRLDQLRARDLKPASLKRTYFEANAHAVRFYDNLRVVRVLESRVDNVRLANGSDAGDQGKSLAAPVSPKGHVDPKPGRAAKKAAENQGVSRRETPAPEPRSLVTGWQLHAEGTEPGAFKQVLQNGGVS